LRYIEGQPPRGWETTKTTKWDVRRTVVEQVDAPDEANAQRILASRLAAAGFTVVELNPVHPYPEYEVEVQQTVRTTVRVQAKNAASAALQVDNVSFPLPPQADDWEGLEGYTYIVREPDSGPVPREILYDGDAQDLQ
jgi:hypothetical protein